jgi:hypothetical protein
LGQIDLPVEESYNTIMSVEFGSDSGLWWMYREYGGDCFSAAYAYGVKLLFGEKIYSGMDVYNQSTVFGLHFANHMVLKRTVERLNRLNPSHMIKVEEVDSYPRPSMALDRELKKGKLCIAGVQGRSWFKDLEKKPKDKASWGRLAINIFRPGSHAILIESVGYSGSNERRFLIQDINFPKTMSITENLIDRNIISGGFFTIRIWGNE